MIKDVSPELYEAIKTEFEKKISGNSAIKSVMDSIESGNSTFRDAYKYAETLGDALAESFDKILSSDTLPDGKMYYNIAKAVVEPFLRENYEATADVAAQVQKVLNTKAKIGMNAITPEVDEDKTKGIIDYISNAEQFDNVKKSFVDSTLNYTQSAVDDTIEQNVDFHAKSGMNPVVTRITVGRVCDWCKSLAGVHKYPVDRDVYRRHENCRCIVEYDPGDGKKQDVWSKITYTEKESSDRIDALKQEYSKNEQLEKINKEKRLAKAQGEKCFDVTEEWSLKATKPGKTIIAESIVVNGNQYVVDGKRVLNDASKEEIRVAEIIKDTFGGNVIIQPRINYPPNIQVSDYLYKGDNYDLKVPHNSNNHSLYNLVHKKKKQSNSFIYDISNNVIQVDDAIKQIKDDVYKSSHTKFVDTIILVKDDKVLKVFERL